MEPFASVADYSARYPDDETPDEVLYEALLEATDLISAAMDEGGVDYSDPTESFTFRLKRICRTVVRRSLGDGSNEADVPFGATQLSETSAQFNASVQFANPYGDMFLTQAERDALGIGGGRACVMSAYAWPADGGDP
jgi:hypothetical protein